MVVLFRYTSQPGIEVAIRGETLNVSPIQQLLSLMLQTFTSQQPSLLRVQTIDTTL